MEIETRQINANRVAEKWAENYGKGQYGKEKIEVLKKLQLLGENPNPDLIDQIIGNQSWTKVQSCDECGGEFEMVIQLGQEPNWESRTAWICKDCLKKALALAETI